MRSLLSAVLALLLVGSAAAQSPSPPKQEFRGAWIATVLGLDWPTCRTCAPAQQQAELRTILDRLQEAGINAALFQVRSESDAMYLSDIEPTSYWLTGEQGKPITWDPLAFAITEAHARGMELHAWFNPYRVIRGSGYAQAPTHVSQTHPEWLLDFGAIKILDPGLPDVRDYVTSVVMDVARRYDIDGVHFDDYFYPYPPNGITNQDAASFATYGGAFAGNVGNWRRNNVSTFVKQVGDSLRAVRPEVSYGISPFGIWKNGVPAGITGLDAYNQVYADAVEWMRGQYLDYLTPQLYWAFGGGQDYAKLAPWWESQRNGRHFYPGHGLYRADFNTFSGTLYAPTEVPRQVRFNRATPGIQGSVFFRARNITQYRTQGFADTLKTDLYRYPALTPTMDWKSLDAPGDPTNVQAVQAEGGGVTVTWAAPTVGAARARFFAVYRIPSPSGADLSVILGDPANLVAVTGETTVTDLDVATGQDVAYAVTAVSPNSVESAPSVSSVITGDEPGARPEARLALSAPFPNPTTGPARLGLTLGAPAVVTARVVDALGREVSILYEARSLGAGRHDLVWEPRSAGTYFVVVTADGQRAVRPVSVVR